MSKRNRKLPLVTITKGDELCTIKVGEAIHRRCRLLSYNIHYDICPVWEKLCGEPSGFVFYGSDSKIVFALEDGVVVTVEGKDFDTKMVRVRGMEE